MWPTPTPIPHYGTPFPEIVIPGEALGSIPRSWAMTGVQIWNSGQTVFQILQLGVLVALVVIGFVIIYRKVNSL